MTMQDITRLRKAAGISQEELASETNISRSYVAKCEIDVGKKPLPELEQRLTEDIKVLALLRLRERDLIEFGERDFVNRRMDKASLAIQKLKKMDIAKRIKAKVLLIEFENYTPRIFDKGYDVVNGTLAAHIWHDVGGRIDAVILEDFSVDALIELCEEKLR